MFSLLSDAKLCIVCGEPTKHGEDVFVAVAGKLMSFHVDGCSHDYGHCQLIVDHMVTAMGVPDPGPDEEEG